MKKWIGCILIYTFTAVIAVPVGITYLYGFEVTAMEKVDDGTKADAVYFDGTQIKVMNPETEEIVETPFEDYIKGVVAAEMPASFEEEALKAQAVAARTYALRKMNENKELNGDNTVPYHIDQAYETKEELKQKWGVNFEKYYQKVSNAVDQTRGEIMVYENEPILAVFHSTSAGFTEDSANVWGQSLPYLKTVDSLEDEKAPGFETQTSLPVNEVIGKLQAKYPDLILTEGSLLEQMQIIERTEAGYVKSIQIGNKIMEGKDVRECLSLRSSDFTIRQEGDTIVFVTRGYGHGAGMSQYGANFMAEEGLGYEEILKHYYNGVELRKESI